VRHEFTAIAVLLTAAGVGALYRAWRTRDRDIRWILAGWGLIAAALFSGPGMAMTDRGAALGLLSMALIAYLLIGLTADRRPPARIGVARRLAITQHNPLRRRGRLARGLWRTVLAGPIAALFGLAIGILLIRHGAGSGEDRQVLAQLLAPVAWAVAMAWSLADPWLRRVSVGLMVALLAAGTGGLA
jgi:hypothetical protein